MVMTKDLHLFSVYCSSSSLPFSTSDLMFLRSIKQVFRPMETFQLSVLVHFSKLSFNFDALKITLYNIKAVVFVVICILSNLFQISVSNGALNSIFNIFSLFCLFYRKENCHSVSRKW